MYEIFSIGDGVHIYFGSGSCHENTPAFHGIAIRHNKDGRAEEILWNASPDWKQGWRVSFPTRRASGPFFSIANLGGAVHSCLKST